jgi:hypothetical protein
MLLPTHNAQTNRCVSITTDYQRAATTHLHELLWRCCCVAVHARRLLAHHESEHAMCHAARRRERVSTDVARRIAAARAGVYLIEDRLERLDGIVDLVQCKLAMRSVQRCECYAAHTSINNACVQEAHTRTPVRNASGGTAALAERAITSSRASPLVPPPPISASCNDVSDDERMSDATNDDDVGTSAPAPPYETHQTYHGNHKPRDPRNEV